jgi:hypothetical protein
MFVQVVNALRQNTPDMGRCYLCTQRIERAYGTADELKM